jgi:hypothetical protein
MPKQLLRLVVYSMFVLPALAGGAPTDASKCGDASVQQQAATYRSYRMQRQRDPDLRTPQLSDWHGDMHKVMVRLGDGLAAQRARAMCVERLLGPPDEVRSPGQRHGTLVVAGGERHLVYWWRGGHDYLYLVVRDARVIQARWWFAYE